MVKFHVLIMVVIILCRISIQKKQQLKSTQRQFTIYKPFTNNTYFKKENTKYIIKDIYWILKTKVILTIFVERSTLKPVKSHKVEFVTRKYENRKIKSINNDKNIVYGNFDNIPIFPFSCDKNQNEILKTMIFESTIILYNNGCTGYVIKADKSIEVTEKIYYFYIPYQLTDHIYNKGNLNILPEIKENGTIIKVGDMNTIKILGSYLGYYIELLDSNSLYIKPKKICSSTKMEDVEKKKIGETLYEDQLKDMVCVLQN